MKRILALLAAPALLSPFLPAYAAIKSPLTLSTNRLSQGDTLVIAIALPQQSIASVTFGGEPIRPFAYGSSSRIVVPIPPTKKPGSYLLRFRYADGPIPLSTRTIRVQETRFPHITMGVPAKLNLTPLALVGKLQEKKSAIAQKISTSTPPAFFSTPFQFPLVNHSRIGSPFGELRSSEGTTIRHLGIDFSAPVGTPVYPINDGVIRQAYFDTLYGNSVIIDHGAGIFSLSLHLDEFHVQEGQRVTKQDTIGTVGQTGYATAPHLHLSLKINGSPVDPARFITSFK